MAKRDLALVVVAAGQGQRLGAGIPKAFVDLVGRPLLTHAIESIIALPDLAQLILAVPESHLVEAAEIGSSLIAELPIDFEVVLGGETRQASIANALAELSDQAEVVLVHDAARALAPTSLFSSVAKTVRETKTSALPVMRVVDTIKRIDGETILETVDREVLRSAQTPQGFISAQLRKAYAETETEYTDDAALMQAAGHQIVAVPGDERAFKITTPADLAAAELRFSGKPQGFRTGIGTDVHRFTENLQKPLFLGTIVWPGERGLDGHSDGDAVSHAIVDALLSAAGLGDIGSNFGVDRPEFSGANGKVFIEGALELINRAGYRVENVAVQIIGNRPKVAPHRVAVETALQAILGAPVSLGATTTDGLGFLGNTEGVAAVATALLAKSEAAHGAEGRLAQ
jgi:2-C-methyl-D-erythritol 4-phosphate cytidylyltransferase / 2-C-methyl-D-erythritol 2,4-cyclodiphosphate synthase